MLFISPSQVEVIEVQEVVCQNKPIQFWEIFSSYPPFETRSVCKENYCMQTDDVQVHDKLFLIIQLHLNDKRNSETESKECGQKFEKDLGFQKLNTNQFLDGEMLFNILTEEFDDLPRDFFC